MRRGACEANEESRQLADARKLGEAFGFLVVYLNEIGELRARIARLEEKVQDITGDPS